MPPGFMNTKHFAFDCNTSNVNECKLIIAFIGYTKPTTCAIFFTPIIPEK